MTVDEFYRTALAPAYALLPPAMESDAATVLLTAIGLQESKLKYRRQIGGPARGLLQFETGGARGVLNHPASAEQACRLARARAVMPAAAAVTAAFENDDVLAAGFARLLLWTDPAPLPPVGDVSGGWAYYLRNWRPGRPHPESWADCYGQAMTFPLVG